MVVRYAIFPSYDEYVMNITCIKCQKKIKHIWLAHVIKKIAYNLSESSGEHASWQSSYLKICILGNVACFFVVC